MSKFVYVYTGGTGNAAPEEQEEAMAAWGAWFGTMGDAVLDMGNPFGGSATVGASGVTSGGAANAGGYSIIEALSLDDASDKAKGCPIIANGGAVEVYEALDM